MTILAGILSRVGERPAQTACAALLRAVSRCPSDEVQSFKDERSFFVKVDIGAFGAQGLRKEECGALSLLAGEPLLCVPDDAPQRTRTQDLELLHEEWKRADFELTATARGAFCAAHYQPATGELLLLTDKLGIRPLYYSINEKIVVFAAALRILEDSGLMPLEMDLRGVTEMTALGYALGSRTQYANVSVLRAAEVLRVNQKRVAHSTYYRWDEIEPSVRSEPEMLRATHARFLRGVACRNRGDRTTVAYLSGGLDSRAVVAALSEQGARVHTFNFALPGTQDYLFGNEFAERCGTTHQSQPKEPGDLTPDYAALMARAWNASQPRAEYPAERPALVWSGEGGSVAFGHVHLHQSIIEAMRAGRTDEAIEIFFEREDVSVTRRLLRGMLGDELSSLLRAGVGEELAALHGADAGRNFYLFLMLNDQRRKLATHFENIDLHRLEFQLPFFDAEFLAQVAQLPLAWCLGHKFYTKWLKLFAAVVTEVAWQTYPGHEPCPIPVPRGPAYQWDGAHQAGQLAARKRELLRQAREMLRAKDFPAAILKRNYLRLASLAYQLDVRDYSYVIQSARTYHTYWRMCEGRYAAPATGANRFASAGGAAQAGDLQGEAALTSGAVK